MNRAVNLGLRGPLFNGYKSFGYYRPQRSCGKVMFLHLSVILFCHTPPGRHPPAQCMLGYTPCTVHAGIHIPLQSACWDTVNKRPIRILLECILVTARKQSLRKGNIFTGVCHSVHRRGGWWCVCHHASPQADTPRLHTPQTTYPLDYVPPWTMYPPGLRTPRLHTSRLHTPQDYVPPQNMYPPWTTYPPGAMYPPPVDGLCAGGTHPTGMHSCSVKFSSN